jgi:hypothetical protein
MIVYGIFATGNDYYDQPDLCGLYHDKEVAEQVAAKMREEKDEYEDNLNLYVSVTVNKLKIQ